MIKEIIQRWLAIAFFIPFYCLASIQTITVLQTSDLHCQLTIPAAEQLGGLINREIAHGGGRSKVILIDSGDLLQGSFVATVGKGRPAIDFLNHVGYDIWTPGNHDLDFGFDVLADRISQFKGVTLTANLKANGSLPQKVKPFTVLDRNGLKIAVIGLTFPTLWRNQMPGEPGFSLIDFKQALEQIMPSVMQAKADIIILNVHYGLSMSYSNRDNSIFSIAGKYPQINLICGGHTHQINPGKDVGYGVWYTEPGKYGQGIVSIRIDYDTDKHNVSEITSKFIPVEQGLKADYPPQLKETIRNSQEQGKKVIGKVAVPFSGSSRGVSNPLQNLFGQTAAQAAGASFALISPPRDGITLQGNITEKDLFELAPYDDAISVIEVTPEELGRLVAEQLSWKTPQQRQLPWGFYVRSNKRGKILRLELPGNPDRCKVAVNSFIVTRGEKWFPELARLNAAGRVANTGITMRDALRRKFKTTAIIEPDFTKWLIYP